MELFKILGKIAIDSDQAKDDLDNTKGKAHEVGEKLKNGIVTAAKWGAALTAAAAATGAALFKVAEKAAAATDAVDKMSQKIGISREAYQELDFICSQSGTSVDTLQMGIKTLTNQMQSAADGTKSAAAMFNKLGVSIYDSNGQLKDQETMMWETMSALQEMENQTEKAAIANDLFGRSGSELMPLLNGASGSIDAMRQQAHDLGLILSDEAVDSGVLFTDTIDQMKRAFSAIGTEIGVGVMPIFQSMAEWVIEHMPQIREIVSSIFEKISTFASYVVDFWNAVLKPVIVEVATWISEHSDEIKQTIQDLWDGVQYIWETVGQPIWDLIQSCIGIVRDAFSEKMPEIKEFVSACFTDIKIFWENNLKPCLEAIGNFIKNVLAPIFNAVFNTTIKGYISTAFDAIKSLWNNVLKPVFTGITDFLTGVFTLDFEKAMMGIVNIFTGIFNIIPTVVENVVNGCIDVLNGLISGVNAIAAKIGLGQIRMIGKVSFPKMEEGGVLEKGQIGFLEGNGAEAVVPLDQNKKWISAVANDIRREFGGLGDIGGFSNDNDQVRELKNAFAEFVDVLPDMLKDAFESMKFDVNNREFARLVKAVN